MKDPQKTFHLLCQGDRSSKLFLAGELRKLRKDIPALLSVGRKRRARKAAERRKIHRHLKWFLTHYPWASGEIRALEQRLTREIGFYPRGEWIDNIGLRSKRGAQNFVIQAVYKHFRPTFDHWPLCSHLANLFKAFNIRNSKNRSFTQDAIHKIAKSKTLPKK